MTPLTKRTTPARIAPVVIAVLIAATACRRGGEEPPIVVEADTLRSRAPVEAESLAADSPVSEPEVVVIEEHIVSPVALEPEPDPIRPAAGGREESLGPVAEGAVAGSDRLLPEALTLPAGTRFVLELRTPLHSATLRVGDRFAARTVEGVDLEGRTAIEPDALVEGRVAGVTRADHDEPGRIELDFRTLVLPSGEQVPLDAEIASVAGRPAERRHGPGPGQVAGGAAAGAGVGGVVGGRKGAVIGAVMGAVGAVLIAGSSDQEVVVPSGTPIEITLRAPIEVPAP